LGAKQLEFCDNNGTKMQKRVVLSVSLTIAVAILLGFLRLKSSTAPSAVSTPSPILRLEAEREVFAVLFTLEVFPDTKSQIEPYTSLGDSLYEPNEEADFVMNGFPDMKEEIIRDFQENNKQPFPIKDYLPSRVDDVFLSPPKDPLNSRQISISRAGFNSQLTQALILVGDCYGDACFSDTGQFMYSTGTYFFLQNYDGKWAIRDKLFAWVGELPPP
jgi:hypothetical protein